MNTLWNTIAQYNAATWPIQVLLVIAVVMVLYLLVERPSRSSTIIAKSHLMLLCVWITMAYHAVYCAECNYSILLSIYWGILALARIKDLLEDDIQFALRDKFKLSGIFILLLPLMYPLALITRGLFFLYITTPMTPCTVTVHTIGLLPLFASRVNIFTVLPLLNWAMVDVAKTRFFGIPEDFILVLMAVLTLYIFFREYFTLDLYQDSKSQVKYVSALLILVCIGVCITLRCAFFVQISRDT